MEGAVVSGAVIGLAILAMLGALWVALAEGTGVDHIAANLHWYAMGSALVSLFLAAMIAGWIAGVRGVPQGMMNGFSVWGLLLVAALAIGTPGALQVIDLGHAGYPPDDPYQGSDVEVRDRPEHSPRLPP